VHDQTLLANAQPWAPPQRSARDQTLLANSEPWTPPQNLAVIINAGDLSTNCVAWRPSPVIRPCWLIPLR
jgi:hypothetical protein